MTQSPSIPTTFIPQPIVMSAYSQPPPVSNPLEAASLINSDVQLQTSTQSVTFIPTNVQPVSNSAPGVPMHSIYTDTEHSHNPVSHHPLQTQPGYSQVPHMTSNVTPQVSHMTSNVTSQVPYMTSQVPHATSNPQVPHMTSISQVPHMTSNPQVAHMTSTYPASSYPQNIPGNFPTTPDGFSSDTTSTHTHDSVYNTQMHSGVYTNAPQSMPSTVREQGVLYQAAAAGKGVGSMSDDDCNKAAVVAETSPETDAQNSAR